jgi:penicillin-binding protein 1A
MDQKTLPEPKKKSQRKRLSANKSKKESSKKKRIVKKPIGIFFKFILFILKVFFILLVAIGISGGGLLTGIVYGYLSTTVPVQPEQLEIRTGLTSYIYDADGNIIMELTGSQNINRIPITYDQMPLYLEQAFIAIEDERFYNHIGIDTRRILSSVYSIVKNRGRIMQGGSTITQQVVKHVTGKWDQSIERKVQEWYNAILLERKYDKKRILTLYANVINEGNGCYGVQAAANYYFDKDVSELSLAECAVLAAIPNAPSTYNPATEKGREEVQFRMKLVLDKMLELGFIDKKEYDSALNEKLEYKFVRKTAIEKPTTYFVDHVLNEVINDLIEQKNITRSIAESMVYNNGYKIYTTMDPFIQSAMDSIFMDPSYFPVKDENGNTINKEAEKYGEIPQAGMVIIDPYTGYVKAMYGGNGEKTISRAYNRATQAKRQPGSSFKPIAVYAPAMDLKLIQPATVIDDVPVYLDEKNPDTIYPTNYVKNQYRGLTSIRYGIKVSTNVVSARVWKEILGYENCLAYLKKVGIDREGEIFHDTVSVSLGGLRTGVSPMEMAAAYTPFVNSGIYSPPTTYTRVVDIDGNVILDNRPEYTVAYSEETAFLMRSVLREVVTPKNSPFGGQWAGGGTAASYILIKNGAIDVAGKTGTTSDDLDKWFVGFTPYYTAAVWYGYDNKIRPIKLTNAEYNQAMIIWNAVMNLIHQDLPDAKFPEPPANIVTRDVCIFSGKIATENCKNDPRGNCVKTEYFVRGTEPSYEDVCDVHVKAKVCTASKDIWGRYLLANPYCDPSTVVEKVFILRDVPWIPSNPNEPIVEDMYYELPAGEYCTHHKPPVTGDGAAINIPPVGNNPNPPSETSQTPPIAEHTPEDEDNVDIGEGIQIDKPPLADRNEEETTPEQEPITSGEVA